jgi:hypothetical protein
VIKLGLNTTRYFKDVMGYPIAAASVEAAGGSRGRDSAPTLARLGATTSPADSDTPIHDAEEDRYTLGKMV